jgi:hypothetical protein
MPGSALRCHHQLPSHHNLVVREVDAVHRTRKLVAHHRNLSLGLHHDVEQELGSARYPRTPLRKRQGSEMIVAEGDRPRAPDP